MNDNAFPSQLLTAPPRERYAYFHNWHVVHPQLVQTRDALLQAIHYGGDCRVIHLFGCTGVGKTTLRLWVEKILTEAAQEQMLADPDYLPVVSVVTPAPDQGSFSWRDVYIQTMYALGEPQLLVNTRKKPPQLPSISEAKLMTSPRPPRAELRLAMTSCLHRRHVEALFYDDAHHFQMVAKAQRLQDQMENLKWLSDMTGTAIVLVGTYDLLNLVDLSGQLARRSLTIHFARYHAENSAEFQQFAGVVYAFQRHLPLAVQPNLVDRCDYLYERTLGCIGLLKEWLGRALAEVLANGGTDLTEKQLESCADMRKLVAVAKEAVAGEQRVYASDGLHLEWQGLLKSAAQIPTPTAKAQQPVSIRQRKNRPGERTAKRDLVGMGVADG